MKKKIAVTGGIGSGKSKVIEYIQALGYPTFSCDAIYREVINLPEYVQEVERLFPNCVQSGGIDKRALAEKVFFSREDLQKLNAVAHPFIMRRLTERMNDCEAPAVFAEVPLLFEGKYERLFDEVVVILRERERRILFAAKRDGCTNAQIEARMAMQFDYDDEQAQIRYKNCNAKLIYNHGTEEELQKKIKCLLEELL